MFGVGIGEIVIIGVVMLFALGFRLWRTYSMKQNLSNEQLQFMRPEVRKSKASPPMRDYRDIASTAGVDWAAVRDERVAQYLPDRKIDAIKAYREITNVGLKEAKDAIEYALANPHKIEKSEKGFNALGASMSNAGIRDLLDAGKFEEAVDAYRTFTGVDTFTARNAVEELQREIDRVIISAGNDTEIWQALRDGKKIEAVKLYRQIYNVGLKEAKDAVDAMERDL